MVYEAVTGRLLNELDKLVGYESFRDGFSLGARLMMEVACGQGRFSDGI